MTNPFEKRATEYIKDDSAFLSVVTPEPLHSFFEEHAKSDALFDRLCIIIGTPGSGKTTIASLIQFPTVFTLINSPNHTEYRPLLNALSKCKIINTDSPKIACRIPMESEYRDLWELPYTEEIKFGLLKSFLQSRAIISWANALKKTNQYDLDKTQIKYREGIQAAGENIGGKKILDVLEKAIEIEGLIYDINARLVPPEVTQIPAAAISPYQPFDSIEKIIVKDIKSGDKTELQPLVIFDDVHSLQQSQLVLMQTWLAKREMKVSRWIMMRLDAQTPEAILREGFFAGKSISSESTLKRSREITQIWLQRSDDRRAYREKFRKMAQSMADKYLRMMPIFSQRGGKFQDLLNTQGSPISPSNLVKLKKKIDIFQKKSNISQEIRISFENDIKQYFLGSKTVDSSEDIRLATLLILMNRYVKRIPQASLFDLIDNEKLPTPTTSIKTNSEVVDGAKIHLLHEFNRPYYYGINIVCDGSSENAEQFLQLAGRLASASEARIIKGSPAALSSSYQNNLLRKRTTEIIREWAFPKHEEIKVLCSHIAELCIKKSLEPNASLGGGANAIGIEQDEFETISKDHPALAQVLKFAVAYNALSIKPYHKTKHKYWTLIELTGPFLISKGLTLTRGGFLEKTVDDLLIPLNMD